MSEDSKAKRNSSTTKAKREYIHEQLEATVRADPKQHGHKKDLSQRLEQFVKSKEHEATHVGEEKVHEEKEDGHSHKIRNSTNKDDITRRSGKKIENDQRHETTQDKTKQETLKKDDYAKRSKKKSRRNHAERPTASTKGESPTSNISGYDRATDHPGMKSNSWNTPNQQRAGDSEERQGKYSESHSSSRRHKSSHGPKMKPKTHRERTSTHDCKRSHSADNNKKQDNAADHSQRLTDCKEPDRKRLALMNNSDTIQFQSIQSFNTAPVSTENKPKNKENDRVDICKESYGDMSSKDDRSVHERSRNQPIIDKLASSSSDSDVRKSKEHYKDSEKEVRSSETETKKDSKQISQCKETDKRETSERAETCSTERKGVSNYRSSSKSHISETHMEGSGTPHKVDLHMTTGTESCRISGKDDRRSEKPPTRSSQDSRENPERIDRHEHRSKRDRSDKSQNLSKERDHHRSAADSRSLQPRKEFSNSSQLGADNHKKKSSTKSHVLKEECNNIESEEQMAGKTNASDMHTEEIRKASNKDVENQKASSGSSGERKANINSDEEKNIKRKEKRRVDMKREFPKSETDNDRHSKVRKLVSDENSGKSSTFEKNEDGHTNKIQSDANPMRSPRASTTVQNKNDTKQIQLDDILLKDKEVSHSIDSAAVQKKIKISIAESNRTENVQPTFDFMQAHKRVKNRLANTNKGHTSEKDSSKETVAKKLHKDLGKAFENIAYQQQIDQKDISSKISPSTKLGYNDIFGLDQSDITMVNSELCEIHSLNGLFPGRELKESVRTEGKIKLDHVEELSTAGEYEEREQKVKEKGKVEEHQEEEDKIWICDLPPDVFGERVISQSEAYDLLLECNISTNFKQDDDFEEKKNNGCSEIEISQNLDYSYSNRDPKYKKTLQNNNGNQICLLSVDDDIFCEVLQALAMPCNNSCLSLSLNETDDSQSSAEKELQMIEASMDPNNTTMQRNMEGAFQGHPSFESDVFAEDETQFLSSLEYYPPIKYLQDANKSNNDVEIKKIDMVEAKEILPDFTDYIQQSSIQESAPVPEQFEDFGGQLRLEEPWDMLTDNASIVESGVLSTLHDVTNGLSEEMEQKSNYETLTIRNNHDLFQPLAQDEKSVRAALEEFDIFSIADMPMDCSSIKEGEYIFGVQEGDINTVSQIQRNEINEQEQEQVEWIIEGTRCDKSDQGRTEENYYTFQSPSEDTNMQMSMQMQVDDFWSTICPRSEEKSKSNVDVELKDNAHLKIMLDRIINEIEWNKSEQANENNLIGGQKAEEETPLHPVEHQPNEISEPNPGLAWLWDVANEISDQLSTNLNQVKNELKPITQNNILEKKTEEHIHSIAEVSPPEIISFDLTDTAIVLNNLTQSALGLSEFHLDFLHDSNHTEPNLNPITETVEQPRSVAEHLILPKSRNENEIREFNENKEHIQLKNETNLKTVDRRQNSVVNPAMKLASDCFGDLESSLERSSSGNVLDIKYPSDLSVNPDGGHSHELSQQQEEQYAKKKIEHSPEVHETIFKEPDCSKLETIGEKPRSKPETDSKSVDTIPIQCNSINKYKAKVIKTKDLTMEKPEARNKKEETKKDVGYFSESMIFEMNPVESVPSSRGQVEVVEMLEEAHIIENQTNVKPNSENQLKRKSIDKSNEIEKEEILDSPPEKKRKSDVSEQSKLADDKGLDNDEKQNNDVNMRFASKPESIQHKEFRSEDGRPNITLSKILTQTELCGNSNETHKDQSVDIEHKTLEAELKPNVSEAFVSSAPKDLNADESVSIAEVGQKFSTAEVAPAKCSGPQTSTAGEATKQQISKVCDIPNTKNNTACVKICQKANKKRRNLVSDETEAKSAKPVDTVENSAQMSGEDSTIINPKSKSKHVPHTTAENAQPTSAQSVDCVEVKDKPDLRDNEIDTSPRSSVRPQMNRSTNIVRTRKFLSVAQKILKESKDVSTKLAAERVIAAMNAYSITRSPPQCSEMIPVESNESQSKETTLSSQVLALLENRGIEANRILLTFKEDLSKLGHRQSPQANAKSVNECEPCFVEDINAIFNARIVRKEILRGNVIKLRSKHEPKKIQPHLSDEDEVDLEEIGVPDNFQISCPINLPEKQSNGLKHPSIVLEMSTLLSIELPKITYTPALKGVAPLGVSDLQVEVMMYACQATEQLLASGQRAGFLLGDGAGVGKSRTLSAIIYENFRQGRKRSLWVSMADHQYLEIDRELTSTGVRSYMEVSRIGQFSFNSILGQADAAGCKKGIICTTYAELGQESPRAGSRFRTHVSQLAHWLGKNGVIVFDDCQKASRMRLVNSERFIKTCSAVLKLQQLLPFARIVYVSDAVISEPRDMVFMARLGLWGSDTPFAEFMDFVHSMEKQGPGAMELVAVDLKLRGKFISRHLSWQNVGYRIEEVPMSQDFRDLYNYSADLWAKIYEQLPKAFRRMRIKVGIQERILQKFWNAHELYFRNLSVASKLTHLERKVGEAKKKEHAVVIGVMSSSEYDDYHCPPQQEGELTSFMSTAKDILQSFIERYFPAPTKDASDLQTGWKSALLTTKQSTCEGTDDVEQDMDGAAKRRRPSARVERLFQKQMLTELFNNVETEAGVVDFNYRLDSTNDQADQISEDEVKHCVDVRENLLQKIQKISPRLPPNSLDKIIANLGGSGEVAELTKRCGRVLKISRGVYKYEKRFDTEANIHKINCAERASFLYDKKRVIIVSENAACSLSLQSIPSAPNRRHRVYVSLELPWSADRAIQQFGCAKRSNQANDPEFVMLVTDVATELLQANMVALKLKSLGARRSDPPLGDPFDRDQSIFMLNSSFGSTALESVLQQIAGNKPLKTEHLPDYQGDFVVDCCKALVGIGLLHVGRNSNGQRTYILNNNSTDVPTFLKRIIGCRIEVQNALLKFFLNKMHALMLQVKQTRLFNMGIIDLDVHGSVVTVTKLITFKRSCGWKPASLELHTVELERGFSFDSAVLMFKAKPRQSHEGFYILSKKRNRVNCAILCISPGTGGEPTDTPRDPSRINLVIIRPNTGIQLRTELLRSVLGRYAKASPMAAQNFWNSQYTRSSSVCSHIYWGCDCPYGKLCDLGVRLRTYHILSGSLLSIWKRVAPVIEKSGGQMQIARVKISSKNRIVGILVPELAYRHVVAELSIDTKTETMDFTIV